MSAVQFCRLLLYGLRGPMIQHRFLTVLPTLILLVSVANGLAQEKGNPINLPSGKTVSSVPGSPQRINSFPVSMAVSPDGHYAVTMNNGFGTAEEKVRQSLSVLDLDSGSVNDYPDEHSQRFPTERPQRYAQNSFFVGLAFSGDGKHVFASMASMTDPEGKGNDPAKNKNNIGNGIMVYAIHEGALKFERFIPVGLEPLPKGKIAAPLNKKMPVDKVIPYCAGLGVADTPDGERLLVANNLSDSAVWMDADSGKILAHFDLSTRKTVPTDYPYGAIVTRNGKIGFISLWNSSSVVQLDLTAKNIVRRISLHTPISPTAAGSHPTAMLMSNDENHLYVALANTDEIAVINIGTGRVEKYLSTKLNGQKRNGAWPVGLALSADGKRFYAANAGTNTVAVFDNSAVTPKLLGFIPTEWYPLSLGVSGNDLLIATGKSTGTGPNGSIEPGKEPWVRGGHPYGLALLHGSLERLKINEIEAGIVEFTREAEHANLMDQTDQKLPFPIGKNPIKHVIYIIKENRTYDQVFGDLKVGNGDASLAMYGEDITPNQHKLALEFGVLDNFYDSAEVSGQGHNWSTAATTSDYLEKTIQIGYRSRERAYDYEGLNAKRIPLEDGGPDVNEPSTGYLWSLMAKYGKKYRHYGEFVATSWCSKTNEDESPMAGTPGKYKTGCPVKSIAPGHNLPNNVGNPHGGASPYPWNIPMIASNVPTKPELRGHFDAKFPDFELDFPDQLRVDEFMNEFIGFEKARKTGKGTKLPNFVMLRLGNDHTSGTSANHATPTAAVADNDLAVGRVVDAISHSAYWDETAILILEDDAQDGADHVDSHRSIALLISKYSPSSKKKPLVESNFYSTVSMIRTLEALLGVPPMNHNDAQAAVIASPFSGKGDHAPFIADFKNRDNRLIYQMNKESAPGTKASAMMDFSHADDVDTELLNTILWQDRFGDRPMPKPLHNETIHQRLNIQNERKKTHNDDDEK